jgi:hypothetical protein
MNSQVSRVWTFDFEPAQVQRFKVALTLTLKSKGLDVWTGLDIFTTLLLVLPIEFCVGFGLV